MAKPTPQQATQEIKQDQWIPFFDEFTRENRGAHARLEVIGVADVGYEVATENRPFDGVSADTKDRERSVWLIFGATPQDHFNHAVQNVTAVRTLPPAGLRGAVLEIEAADGTRAILTLTPPEEYLLPPGETQKQIKAQK